MRPSPLDFRCQVYVMSVDDPAELHQCLNEGTHWEVWSGCHGEHDTGDECIPDDISWECDGPHRIPEVSHA